LRLSWSRLLAADLLAKALGFLVVAPVTALMLRFFASRSGSSVITDEDILFFFLSPAGAAALLVIGVFTFWIVFAEHAVLLTIGYGTIQRGGMTLRSAFRIVAARAAAIFRLAARLLLTIIAIAIPFLAAAAVTYLVLLTRFDINYYLVVRPAAFWTAGALLGLIFAALAAVTAIKLLHWLFALPILLFEGSNAKAAIAASRSLSQGNRLSVLGSLVGLAAVLLGLSALVTGAIAALGRFVVPATSESLLLVALAVGAVIMLSGVADLVLAFLGAGSLSLLVVRLYVKLGGSGQLPPPTDGTEDSLTPNGGRRLRRFIILGSAAAIVSTVVIAVVTVQSIPVVDTTEITAHRGSSAAAPENTLAAMEQAIADGADWVEIDVQEAGDGTIIVFHDADLRRLGGVPLRTTTSSYDELREVDIGSWLSPRFSDQRIPTLEQVLELCKDHVGVNIELKYYAPGGDLERKVIAAVERHGMESQVVLMSLDRSGILKAKEMRPSWKMGLLTAVALGDLTRIDVDFLAVNANLATRSLIWSAHRRGKEVHVWTVNEPVQMWSLTSRGVDNLITDVPATGRALLEERKGISVVERLLIEFGAWSGLIPGRAVPADENDA